MFFLLWRYFKNTLTGTAYFVFVINALFQLIPLFYTYSISRPTYSSDGEIVDPGSDLNLPGVVDYVQDILYFCSFIQFLSSFTFFAMYLYLVVIGYSIYLVVQICNMIPSVDGQGAPDADPKKRKTKYKVRYWFHSFLINV